MEIDDLKIEIIHEIGPLIETTDMRIFHEFLRHGELALAIEFICDKLFENDIYISERLSKMLRVAAAKLEIAPENSWSGIVVIEEKTGRLWRMLIGCPSSEGVGERLEINHIFPQIEKYVDPGAVSEIRLYWSHNEPELALESLCCYLIEGKIQIPRKHANTIRALWLDLGRDQGELKELIVENDESGENN